MKQTNSFSILCFILISVSVAYISAQQCINNGNFIPNSTYDDNRRLILSSLPSSVKAQEGFFNDDSMGQEPNRVYAIGMCIPGSALDDCYVCIDTAFKGLIKSCPNQTEAYSWPGDPTLCLVRYSNTSFSGSVDLDPHVLDSNTGDITSNLTEFKKIWEDLIGRMIVAASTARSTPSSSSNYYKADVAALTKVKSIYALMQCTPDISPGDCEKCLRRSVMEYQSCCGQKQGGVVLQPSCYFKWDLYPYSKAFDNITGASPPPMAVPQPPRDQGNTTKNDSKRTSAGVVVAITVPTVVTVLILLVLGLVLCRKRKPYQEEGLLASWWFARRGRSYQEVELNQTGVTTIHTVQFNYETIKAATNDFSYGNKIGQGGFGSVFKGTLPNGKEIAVKRLLRTSEQSREEFKNEVLVAKLQHKNLVKLIGFSVNGEENIIVYEFLPNKSLDYILSDPTKRGELDWEKRSTIIEGIARGILYLHRDSRLTIIHRDLKPGNILLDTDMNSRITDFGTAKIFVKDQTRAYTERNAGTPGYMSPEYWEEGQFSMKSDVYSFGVLVLEIICGTKASTFVSPNLVTHAWNLWINKSPLDLLDSTIAENSQTEEVTRCIHIALLCVQEDPKDRPDISKIMSMLTSNSIIPDVPQPPGFFDSQNNEGDGFVKSQLKMGSTPQTINDVTVTSLDPR